MASRRYRLFRRSGARAAPEPAHAAFRYPGRPPRPSAATAYPAGAMAAAVGDGAVKPLQCAMKLANGAIELDTGNRPRVRRAGRGGGGSRPAASPVGVGEGGAAGWAPPGLSEGSGARARASAVTLDSSRGLLPSVFPSVH